MPTQHFPRSKVATLKAIGHYERLLRSLRRHLSTHFSINSRLPPEILSDILLLLVTDHCAPPRTVRDQDGWQHEWEITRPERPYGWLRYTHVCRHWREIALQRPQLWSFVIYGSGDEQSGQMLNTLLSRSQQAPLTVTLMGYTHIATAVRRQILDPELHRIRHLTVVSRKDTYHDHSVMISLRVAPILRTLVLKGTISLDSVAGESVQLPALQELRGVDATFSFSACAYLFVPTLTHISLSYRNLNLSESVQTLLTALRGTPLLQSLSLSSRIWVPEDEEHMGLWPKVKLPHLQFLKIECFSQIKPWVEVLRHIDLPSTTRFIYESWQSQDRDLHRNIRDHLLPLASSILLDRCDSDRTFRRTTGALAPSIVSLSHMYDPLKRHFRIGGNHTIKIWNGIEQLPSGAHAHPSQSSLSSSPFVCLKLDIHDPQDTKELLNSLVHDLVGTHAAAFTTLFLRIENVPVPDSLLSVYLDLPNIETLYIESDPRCTTGGIFEIPLGPPIWRANDGDAATPASDQPPPVVPFPKLKTIVIRCPTSLYKSKPDYLHEFDIVMQDQWLGIRSMLHARQQHGYGVEKIILLIDEGTPFSQAFMDELQGAVSVVQYELGSPREAKEMAEGFKERPEELLDLLRRLEG